MKESVTATVKKAAKAARPTASKTSKIPKSQPAVSDEQRRAMIAEAAYHRAEQRGFSETGTPERDWLEAEQEVDALVASKSATGKAKRAH
ncbi:MAG: DUF2934 domain-containing protein [Thiogranum sp.]|nr:DUF2934 domain-containing protein [Thiogranum sp.]